MDCVQTGLKKTKDIQMRCLHDILGVTLWDRMRNTAIQEKIGELLVEDQLRQRGLQWFGHVWRMATHHPQRQLVQCRPSGRKRPPGGAPLQWVELISDDLRGMTNWTKVIQDCAQW